LKPPDGPAAFVFFARIDRRNFPGLRMTLMTPTARTLLALALLMSPAAAAEVEANPYGAIFLSQPPATSGDRAALLDRSIKATRRDNEMDEKFCWQ
jgi:hypothetical protein